MADRDQNASIEVQRLGLEELGVEFEKEEPFSAVSNGGLGQSECSGNRTPVETGISESEHHRDALLSNSVVETGSPVQEQGSPALDGAIAE
jgi:hypothetical protein